MFINLEFWLQLTAGIIVSIWLFYIPGKVLGQRFFPSLASKNSVCFGVGLSLWALASYFLHMAGIKEILWVYLIVMTFIFFRNKLYKTIKTHGKRANKVLLTLVAAGVLFQLLSVAPSGIRDKVGVRFYQVNATDGVYYLALDKSLINNFPPQEPGFSGNRLINYHYFSNLVIADFSRMFGLSIIELQFQTMPLVLSVALGFLAYEVGLAFTVSKVGGLVSSFLIYFGSDLGYLISLILLHKLSVTNLQAIDRSTLLFVNPPRAFAFVVLLAGILLLFEASKKFSIRQFFVAVLILASTVGFKVYVGLYSAMMSGILAAWIVYKRKTLKPIYVLTLAAAIYLAIFLPNNRSAGGLFLAPFTWPRHYFASTALQAVGWHLQETVFIQHDNILHLIVLYAQYTIVFLFAVFGTRLVGFLGLWPKIKGTLVNWSLIAFPTVVSMMIGLLFLQKSGIFETFNFFSTAALGFSLLSAYVAVSLFSRRKFQGIIFVILLIILTLPRPVADAQGQIKNISDKVNLTRVFSPELSALDFVKQNTPKSFVILVTPSALDYQTPYVEFFSERKTYLSGLNILQAHNQKTKSREEAVKEVFSSKTKKELFAKLNAAGINLLYVKLPIPSALDFNYSQNDIFYRNSEVLILKAT